MRTPRFWYPEPEDRMSALKAQMLAPLSCLFRLGAKIRSALAQSYCSRRPVICVGNVVAGGAGKTPTALALAEILKNCGEKPVFVTRGYGGKGELTCVNLAKHGVNEVGDEALLLAACAPTWVARDRVKALQEAEINGSVVIVDDGLQNPYLGPTASILVVDGNVGIGNGRIIPAGPLREPLEDALDRVAAMILIGTCDRQNLAALAKVPVFRAHLDPKLALGFPRFGKFVAFAGIARPEKFFATAEGLGLDIAQTKSFPDHHIYSQADIDSLRLEAEEAGARLLTTEKDAVRLPPDFRGEVVILPVRLIFDDPGAEKSIAELLLRGRP